MKMKKFFAMMTMMLSLVAGFSSCDDDVEEAINLSGEWEGKFGMYYMTAEGHTYFADNTVLYFEPAYAYATHGTGSEFDYYARGPIEFEYFAFTWEVNNGVISLTYKHHHELDVQLHDYNISRYYFTGYFESGTRFSLDKTYDYYDWDGYSDCDYYYHDRYASRSRAEDVVVVSKKEDTLEISHGRDLALSGNNQ